MAIAQSNTRPYNPWVCRCDYCGSEARYPGTDPGDASDRARKEGFAPVSVRVGMPMKWACKTCKAAIDKDKK